MILDPEQLAAYRHQGFLFFPKLLDEAEVAELQAAAAALSTRELPQVLRNAESGAPRLVYAPHVDSAVFDRLTRLPRLLRPVEALLGGAAYIHQCRLNLKLAFADEGYPWHQDFVAWSRNDGMAKPQAVMCAVFLHDCTAANGPLLVIPGSHSEDVVEIEARENQVQGYTSKTERVPPTVIAALAAKGGIADLAGPAGSVAFIHPTLMHASHANLTPWARTICYVNYNAVANRAPSTDRTWWRSNPDATPLTLAEDAVLA